MSEYVRRLAAEFLGTYGLVVAGCGAVVANDLSGGAVTHLGISIVFGAIVMMMVVAFGPISGAHINPAVTLGLLSIGELESAKVPTYLAGQFTGAILGAIAVWLAFLPHWEATDDPKNKLGVFSTGPAIDRPGANFLTETIGTFVLVLGLLAIYSADSLTPEVRESIGVVHQKKAEVIQNQWAYSLKPLLAGLLVFVIGMGLGGPTGYAINPARDLGPRIVHALLPIAGKGDSNWRYAWIPVAGPITGGILGALAYKALWL